MLTIGQKIVNELKSEINLKTFEVGVFSRGVPLNQFQFLFTSCIDICLSCHKLSFVYKLVHVVICLQVGTRCHLFTSCYTLSFVYKLLHVFTMSFKFTYHHVRKSRSEMTWRSAKRSAKRGSKVVLYTTYI